MKKELADYLNAEAQKTKDRQKIGRSELPAKPPQGTGKHTAGTWTVKEIKGQYFPRYEVVGKYESSGWTRRICTTPQNVSEKQSLQSRADAALIAAAPELLAACKAFLESTCGEDTERAEELIENAIAKAEGAQ